MGADEVLSKASVVSVGYLVRQWNHTFEAPEQWYLGLVQRDEVWTAQQRVDLLDSLLKEYPVGAILLGRPGDTSDTATVFVKDKGGARVEETVAADTWQILDGQQRMSTLATTFSTDERLAEDGRGHAELDMTVLEGGVHWIDSRESAQANSHTRSQRIDLSTWSDFVLRHTRLQLEEGVHSGAVLEQLLAELDSDFATPLSGERGRVASERWSHLLDLWFEDRIPVLRAAVRSPEQLLEVFTRVNLAGTAVSQSDVYYAAVKTFWPQAETSLQRIVLRTGGLLDRFAVLEFASRFARVTFGSADPINVNVAILNGPQGKVLRRALTSMCAADSVFVGRLDAAATWLVESSKLGWGLHSVHRRSIAAVLAWAISSPAHDRVQLMEDNATAIDAFLAGTTIFGYRSRLSRDRFDRTAFREALAAGEAGQQFPGVQIREVLREEEGEERFSRIDSLGSREGRRDAGDRHPTLVLSCVQEWPFHAGNLHIDHIYASEASRRDMRVDGEWGRKRAHELRSLTINCLGNFWLLPAATNEALGDDRPIDKFAKLNRWLAEADPAHPVPVRNLWSIDSDVDEKRFIEVHAGLVPFQGNESADRAMTLFHDLVASRAERLTTEFLQVMVGIDAFARGVPGPGAEPSDVTPELAATLGLGELLLDFVAEGNPLPSGGVAEPLATPWSGPWGGRESQVRAIWQAVSRLRTDGNLMTEQTASNPHARAKEKGFAYCRWVRVTRDRWTWFGARLEVTERAPWPLAVVFADAAPEIRRALLESSFDQWVPHGPDGDISIPVPVDPGLPERRAVDAVIDFFYQLETVLDANSSAGN